MVTDLSRSICPSELWTGPTYALPPTLYLGTSTWAFPGWRGIVYRQNYRSERDFTLNSLAEYAQIPWFRTVCIDSFFYNPPSPATLARYASQTPPEFRWISKVWERITIISYPRHARYGALAGQRNPDFLNQQLFNGRVLSAYSDPLVKERTGPFIFQFAPFSQATMAYPEFIERLSHFLRGLPSEFEYAVEVRNPELLTPSYFNALNEAHVTHCFNHWNSMVSLRAQMRAAADAGGLAADFYVARLLTPLGVSYEAATKLFQPYSELRTPNPHMRRDVLTLVTRSITTGKRAYITANNKAEGNSALTMASIARLTAAS